MQVEMLTVGAVQENCFIARPDGGDRAVIVDPGEEAPRLLDAIERWGLTLDAILLTHTHFDHVGAVAPVARATGAPVYCPQLEVPVLQDVNAFIPWPGFGPYESWDPEHTVAGGETLELAGLTLRRRLHARPQSRPRDVRRARRARAVLRRRPVRGLRRARSTCPAATGRRSCARSPTLLERFDDDTVVYPGHMGITTLGARARVQPVPRASCRRGEPSSIQVPRGTYDVLPDAADARAALEAIARRVLEGAGYRPHRDAVLRVHRPLRARRRRVDGHRAEGDVHLRRRRRALDHAAPRGHRADLPRLRRARHAQAAPAGEALVPVELLSQGEAAGRAATASSGRSAPRRWAPTIPPSTPRRSSLLATLLAELEVGGVRLRIASLGTPAARSAYRERAAGLPARATRTSCPARCARASSSTRCARSTPTTRARAR